MTLAYPSRRFAIHRLIQQLTLKDLRKRHGKQTQHLTQQRVGIIKEREADYSHQHGDCGAGEHLAETAINIWDFQKTRAPWNLLGHIGISWNLMVVIMGYIYIYDIYLDSFKKLHHLGTRSTATSRNVLA